MQFIWNVYMYITIYWIYKKKIQKILSNIDNNKKCFWANQHIRGISEGSCDTEAWRNDAENLALHHRKKIHIKIYSHRKQLF